MCDDAPALTYRATYTGRAGPDGVRSNSMKTVSSFARLLLGAAGFAVCALIASHAWAFSLKVTPIPIVIAGGAASTMVELQNESSEPVRVQAAVFDWVQGPTGEDSLSPSTELLIFPSMLTIKPGEARKVRVGTQGGYGANEKPFRVIFSELPTNVSAIEGNQEVVKVVANISVPIFVRPPGAVGAPKVEGLSVTKDRVRFGVRNGGTAHLMAEKIHVEFTGASGNVVGSTDVAGWYVLPGRTRPFEVEIGKSLSCAGAKKVVVTASSRESGQASATLDQPACAL